MNNFSCITLDTGCTWKRFGIACQMLWCLGDESCIKKYLHLGYLARSLSSNRNKIECLHVHSTQFKHRWIYCSCGQAVYLAAAIYSHILIDIQAALG